MENSGPGTLVVNVGSTRHTVARVATVARAPPVPSLLKTTRPCRSEPASTQIPRIPLQVIITAAKTVSRARVVVSPLPPTMSMTMSPTSMMVTATARISDP